MSSRRTSRWRRVLAIAGACGLVAVGVACESGGAAEDGSSPEAGGSSSDAGLDGAADGSPDASTGPAALLAGGDIALLGLTTDGYAIYRRYDVVSGKFSMWAIAVTGGAPIVLSADMGGGQFIGRIMYSAVGFWTGVGPDGLGTFNVWTKATGIKSAPGATSYRNLFSVTLAGDMVMFSSSVSDGGLVDGSVQNIGYTVAPTSDLNATAFIRDVNLAAMENGNCPAQVLAPFEDGKTLLVSHCTGTAPNAVVGRVVMAKHLADGGVATSVLLSESSAATAIIPFYGISCDSRGSKLFVVGAAPLRQGRIVDVDGGSATVLDEGVTAGEVMLDSGTVFYTASGALKRATTEGAGKITVVGGGYDHLVDRTPDERRLLYASLAANLTDLHVADVTKPGETTALVPDASVGSAAFSGDGEEVVYTTVDPSTGLSDCFAVRVDGSGTRKLASGVVLCQRVPPTNTVLVVVNPHQRGPFPVADLETIDLAAAAPVAVPFEREVFDVRNANKGLVVYVKMGAEAGLYSRPLP